MATFSSRPLLFLEENQYNNFEWVGETADGNLLCVWEEEVLVGGSTATSKDNVADDDDCGGSGGAASLVTATHIAISSADLQSVQVVFTFDKVLPIVQATVNSSRTLLGYVVREEDLDTGVSQYSAFVAEISPQGSIYSLSLECDKQILLEFLNTEDQCQISNDSTITKLLVLVHRLSISVYSFPLRLVGGASDSAYQQNLSSSFSGNAGSWVLADEPLKESVCGPFLWGQWSPGLHHLYYLHHRPPPQDASTVSIDGREEELAEPRVMLTALQFHTNKPRETVLNVPLELAGLDAPGVGGFGSDYRDQGLLHTTSDPWLDLRVLASRNGAVCICHHYIYKSRSAITPADPSSLSVFVAYSVTLLHQGQVLHAVLEEVPWVTAQAAQPAYSLLSEHYLCVIIPGVCCHLLDVSMDHPPTAHLLCPPPACVHASAQLYQYCPAGVKQSARNLVFVECCPGDNLGSSSRVLELRISKDSLYQYFRSPHTSLHCRVAALHMAAIHDRDHDLTRKLVWSVCSCPLELGSAELLEEYLVAETFAAIARHLQSDAQHLLQLLPVTTHPGTDQETCFTDSSGACALVRLSYCPLENAPIMLLAPRERVIRPPYADTWTRLYSVVNNSVRPERFPIQHVVDKLMVSLETYKPEALSQGMTPLSPASPLVGGLTITSLGITLAHLMFDPLPFNETENTASSKLEHLLSVSLRELSMYCLKHFPHESPMRVHAVASKYVCTQLQVSRRLCSILCSSQTVVPPNNSEKGFSFIEQLDPAVCRRLFMLLERYHSATHAVAFPLPQGYNSFFAYLGFRCLPLHLFQQYLERGVIQLNVDVLREIIYEVSARPNGQSTALELVSCVPAMRSVRALQYWPRSSGQCAALLTARYHAAAILQGEGGAMPRIFRDRRPPPKGDPFPMAERISPYATLIDLLTAKAKLSELDLGVLHEGTLASNSLAGLPLTAFHKVAN